MCCSRDPCAGVWVFHTCWGSIMAELVHPSMERLMEPGMCCELPALGPFNAWDSSESGIPAGAEMDQAEAPSPAALGFPTCLLTGLSETASLMAFVAPKTKCPPLLPHSQQKFGPLKSLFFPVWRGSAAFPRVFLLEDSVRLSDWFSSAVRDGTWGTPAMTTRECTHSHHWLLWTLPGLGSLERRHISDWKRTLIRLSSEKGKLQKLFKNCIPMLSALPSSDLPLRETEKMGLRNSKWNISYFLYICWFLMALKNCFRDVWVFQSLCQRLMSLKLEVHTGFAVGCSQSKAGQLPNMALRKLTCTPWVALLPWLPQFWAVLWELPPLEKGFSWSFLTWILVKIQSGSRKKEKSAFEALILLTGVDYYKFHVFNPAATSHTFHFAPMEGLSVKTRKKGGTAPGWGICASGWFSSAGIGLLRVTLRWNKWELWEQDLYICVASRKGTLKDWEALCSLGCEIQERLEWELFAEMNCDELPSSVIMSCSVLKGSEICPLALN